MDRKRDAVSATIVARFYEAYYALKEEKTICNVKEFCDMINVDRGAFYAQKLDNSRFLLDLSWLVPLVENGISSKWLLTGKGKMK